MASREHWEAVYRDRGPDQVSWHQENPARSFELVVGLTDTLAAPLIDVGGGASRLVDCLVDHGYRDITVLDLSGSALAYARDRLGSKADSVTWIEADVTAHRFSSSFDVWHDRAVFHFLTNPVDRARYLSALESAVRPGGHVIIATFGVDGPERCSGLPVERYAPDRLADTLGSRYVPVRFEEEEHHTPAGVAQHFLYGVFRRTGF